MTSAIEPRPVAPDWGRVGWICSAVIARTRPACFGRQGASNDSTAKQGSRRRANCRSDFHDAWARRERLAMDERSASLERRLSIPMLFVALLVIPTLILENSHVGGDWRTAAAIVNGLVWLAFVAELILMLRVVP